MPQIRWISEERLGPILTPFSRSIIIAPMLVSYEDYLECIEKEAVKDGLGDLRLAREEFHNLCGKFEDGEPWFELRMNMFIEWYLLDRPGPDKRTPVERFLKLRGASLSPKELAQMEHLTATMRSLFRLSDIKGSTLKLEDMIRGGRWKVESTTPTLGLSKNDIVGARIVFFDHRPIIGRGIVLHPRDALEAIEEIVGRARGENFEPKNLVNHFDKMRLKLDRYSNVRIQHVYRYPGDALF